MADIGYLCEQHKSEIKSLLDQWEDEDDYSIEKVSNNPDSNCDLCFDDAYQKLKLTGTATNYSWFD